MRVAIISAAIAFLLASCGPRGEPGSTQLTHSNPATGTGIPENWTHKELVGHLEQKGAKYRLVKTTAGVIFGPAAYLVDAKSDLEDEKEIAKAFHNKSPDVIYCQLRKSAQDAKDYVGNRGDEGFASGRFAFTGQPAALAKLRQLLP